MKCPAALNPQTPQAQLRLAADAELRRANSCKAQPSSQGFVKVSGFSKGFRRKGLGFRGWLRVKGLGFALAALAFTAFGVV